MLCLGSPAVLQITGSQAAARQQEASRGQGSQLSTSRLSLLDTGSIINVILPSTYLLSTVDNYSAAIEKGGHYSVDNGVSILCSVLLCGVCIRCQ